MKRLLLALCFLIILPGAVVRAQDLPDEALVNGVSGHAQKHNLSCEARSAADWAAFFGYSVGENELLDLLPRSDNPETGFVGSPDGVWGNIPPNSYGVYPPPLAAALRSLGVPAQEAADLIWDDLRAEIAADRPVIVWVVGQMWNGAAQDYKASDGNTVRVAAFEHTMLLVGYTSRTVTVVDAYSGLTLVYSLQAFLQSWETLGRRAILYNPPVPQPTPTSLPSLTPTTTPTSAPTAIPTPTMTPTPTDRVGVRPGDTLIGLARRFNLTWQALSSASGLKYPYFIYPGDVLKLPSGARENPTPIPTPTITPLPRTATPTPLPTDTPQPTATAIQTYIVQRGDYLIDLAQRFGVDWRRLVEINNIPYPWTIYPGQVLKIQP